MNTLSNNSPSHCSFVQYQQLLKDMDNLYHKYEKLQNFYYAMYIESFKNSSWYVHSIKFIKLYNDFKSVCRLLKQIKNLIEACNHKSNLKVSMLGSAEIKMLINYSDIKKFLDKNNLYPIIETNYCID
jgi:hypothetical protein